MINSKIKHLAATVVGVIMVIIVNFLTPEHITGNEARIYKKQLGFVIVWGGLLLLAATLFIYQTYKKFKRSRHENPKK